MSLVECVSITPGDEIRVNGEWLDVIDIRQVTPAGQPMVLITCDNEPGLPAREFLAAPFAHRRVKRHAPLRPTIDPSLAAPDNPEGGPSPCSPSGATSSEEDATPPVSSSDDSQLNEENIA